MRTFVKLTVVAGLMALLAGPALAQDKGKGRRGGGQGGQGGQGRGFGGRGGFNLFLLANTSVQEEIKATDAQKEKVREYQTKEREEMMARFGQGGERPTPEQLAESAKKTADARDKFAKETLKDDQYKRYNQIRIQEAGILAFAEDKVVTAMKLTGEQKEKVKALTEDYTKDLRELAPMPGGGGGNFQELAQKRTALKKEFMTKAEKVLTEDQKSTWKELVGKAFEVRPDAGGRGRRGQDKDK